MFFSKLLYYLVIKPISLLPHWMLYGVSDFLFVIFYYIIPYRKKVVMDNLTKSFPEKTPSEIKSICRKFYRHFTDLVIESLKNFSISEKEVNRRMVGTGLEMLETLHSKGKSIILCGGHYANWEFWALACSSHFKHPVYALYTRLTNPFFEKKMKSSREKFGLKMIPTKEYSQFLKDNITKIQFTSVFGFDQSPSNPDRAVWIKFLGRDTAAHFGAEKYAKEYNLPVVYGHKSKTSRGYYNVHYELVTEDPNSFAHGELTQKLHNILEADIRKTPQLWLWSHKRWKHKRKNEENA